HPGRNGGGEALAQERPQRHILPRLDVARAPIIEKYHTKQMIGGGSDRDRLAQLVAWPHEDGHFQFKVKGSAGTKDRRRRPFWLTLAARPAHGRAARNNRTGASMIG